MKGKKRRGEKKKEDERTHISNEEGNKERQMKQINYTPYGSMRE